MNVRFKKRVTYKDGTVIEKGTVLPSLGVHLSPVFDRARSHPKVWGEYHWNDEPHHAVKVGDSHYSIEAKHVVEIP